MVHGKSLLLGILAGGVVSGTATLFSAPTSGRELRTQAKERGEEIIHSVDKLKTDGRHLTEQIAKSSKEGALLIKDLSEEMKSSIEHFRSTIAPHQKNIQKYLAQIEESLKELEEKTRQANE
ncbi:YtxH domain-containing protein [Aquibacillus salsiterrae]|uniref:YtxH domain-containing protein n=1 Tax=Aquibacillus salsiterrae TaxID=2950439 RepID=A0A9X3WFC5_9BACI|nr:YtxH domain-containing protein [Aquibacillus salsiterrae]MDC3417270.1 YtxH domain-containing protein [Aquibacillus salsiterrae]